MILGFNKKLNKDHKSLEENVTFSITIKIMFNPIDQLYVD